MPKFGNRSRRNLATADEDLRILFENVVDKVDCSVLEGFRNKKRQNAMVKNGFSELKWPLGNHNKKPSLAVDVVPYPIDWKNIERFRMFSAYVYGVAETLGIQLRYGSTWRKTPFGKLARNPDHPHYEIR